MRSLRFALMAFGLCGLLAACSGDGGKDALPPDEPVDVLYNRAMNLLDKGERHDAAKAFSEVERQHPYSLWATRAQLMEAYADYLEMEYDESVKVLSDFIELHPGHPAVAYAYYLRALCYYERIADVRRDQGFARDALKSMQDLISRFPDTVYARDSVLKIALINDHLAGAEMEVGRWYLKQKVYIAAVGRFRTVVEQYQTTSHVPEAMERLVEAYLSLGINDEAKRNAAVLGYNFPGSEWYQDAYSLLVKRGVVTEGEAESLPAKAEKAQSAEAPVEKPVEASSSVAAEPAKASEMPANSERALPPDFSMMKDMESEKKADFLSGSSSEAGSELKAIKPEEPLDSSSRAGANDTKQEPEIRIDGNEAKTPVSEGQDNSKNGVEDSKEKKEDQGLSKTKDDK